MKPITRKEYYLAKAAGTYTGPTPPPVLREDYYLATLSGDYSGYCPAPVTRLDMFMSAAAGLTTYVPQPVTRLEKYLFAIAKGTGYVPEPVTREEKFLYAILKNPPKPEYLDKTAEGSMILLDDSAEAPLTALTLYGKSTQDGTPSPENPVPIVSAGDSGEIEAKVYGGNLISSDISSWNRDGWIGTVLQLSDGIKIKAINGWEKAYYDTSEMNGKTLNLSFDYRQIESETTSPITEKAFAVVVQDENIFPTTADDFPFQINSPETVKTHVSVSFIARNYLCLYLRVSTEGVEAGETRAIEVTNIMLNAGNTELTYEPYKTPQSIVLSTPNGLPGIPVDSGGNYTDESGQQWVCDEIDLARGKYVQRVKKFVVTSDTGIGSMNLYSTAALDVVQPFRVDEYNGQIIKSSAMMAKNFVVKQAWNIAEEAAYTVEQTIDFNILNERIGTSAESTSEEAVVAVREWLKDNPLTFLCQLITPIETDLPAEEIAAYKALHTYSPTTTVSNDAEAWMKVGYKANP